MIPSPPRNLPFTVFLNFLLDSPRAVISGVFFCIFPLLMAIPFTFLFSSLTNEEPDFDKVLNLGKDSKGIVLYKDIVSNITINGVNPIKIIYEYEVDGNKIKDSFQTMSVMSVKNWQKGEQIIVRHFDGDSIIPELEPVNFPFWIFLMIPFIFVIIGLPFLIYAVHRALKKKKLYSKGHERTAKIISMAPVGKFIFSFFKDRFQINYSYTQFNGQEGFGKSTTTDLSLINEKAKGDEVTILFDPNNEHLNCLVDDIIMMKCSQKV